MPFSRSAKGKNKAVNPREMEKNDWNASKKPPVKSQKKFLFCGGSYPLTKDKCPAWGQKCSGCGGRNHFKSVSKSHEVHGISDIPEEPSSEESDIEFLAGVALESKESEVHAVGFAK